MSPSSHPQIQSTTRPGHSTMFPWPPLSHHHLYVHIYDKPPKHEVYKIQHGDAPIQTVQRTHYWGEQGQETCFPPHTRLPTTLQALPSTGQPRQRDPTGHSSDITKRRKDKGVWLRWTRAPTSVDREDQSGCTRQDRQTKRRVRDEVGPQPETPQPGSHPLPSTRMGSQAQVGIRGHQVRLEHG